ncbi:AAA family ATPase [Leptospira sp. 96542]|nr:AAA family ATPase [Leptospira sp. 96542]
MEETLELVLSELCRLTGNIKKIRTREPWEYPAHIRNHPLSVDLDLCNKYGLFAYLDTTKTKQGFNEFLDSFVNNGFNQNDPVFITNRNFIQSLIQRKNAPYHNLRKLQIPGAEPDEKWEVQITDIKEDFFEIHHYLRFIYPVLGVFTPIYVLIGSLFSLPFIPFLLLLNGILFISYRKNSYSRWQKIQSLAKQGKVFQKSFIYNAKDRKTSKRMLNELAQLGDSSEYLVSFLPHLVLNVIFLWDLWKIKSFSKWKTKYSNHWNENVNYLLLLDKNLPFANFSYLNLNTTLPLVANSLKSQTIVHPMLPRNVRKFNPLPEVKPGDLVIITGSNMSGKTTYLRSIAVSLLFAKSGANILGSNFTFPNFEIHTLIRSQDSLEDGVSFFYSEVRRLSEIIKNAENSSQIPILFLDEILKGTNSKERYIATREILKALKNKNTIVFLTTHDLKLAEIPWAKLYHFTELELDGQMIFDYQIRDGISHSTNALKILKKEGIPIEDDSD